MNLVSALTKHLRPGARLVDDEERGLNRSGCVFCDVSKERGFHIVFENDGYVAFRDIRPAAAHHIQVVPKVHIESVKVLGKDDVSIVSTMKDIGSRVLDDLGVPPSLRRMGFHIPPYISVGHLHLHVQALPYRPLRCYKYPIAKGSGGRVKGFSWFVDVDQALTILGAGRQVRIGAC